jgi:hypothetical protein
MRVPAGIGPSPTIAWKSDELSSGMSALPTSQNGTPVVDRCPAVTES